MALAAREVPPCGSRFADVSLIELSTGLLFVAAYLDFGITAGHKLKWLFLTCLVIVPDVTDLRVRMPARRERSIGRFRGGLCFRVVPPNVGSRSFWLRFFQVALP